MLRLSVFFVLALPLVALLFFVLVDLVDVLFDRSWGER